VPNMGAIGLYNAGDVIFVKRTVHWSDLSSKLSIGEIGSVFSD